MHHALVDGKSALEVALLLFDTDPDAAPGIPAHWQARPAPGSARLAAGAIGSRAGESLRAARSAVRMAGEPRSAATRLAGTLRRAALAAGEDLLRPAPSSALNARIGPRRRLVRHSVPVADVLAAKQRLGVTLNDVCLAMAAGALRELSLARGESPRPLKAMVPVNVRDTGDEGSLGNRISFAFIDLPLDVAERPRAGRAAPHARPRPSSAAASRPGRRPCSARSGCCPTRCAASRPARSSSPRVYNLTISNVPGPRVPVYMLGAELVESHPVVPIAEGHALSIGIFSHCERLSFGLYADPDAFPQVDDLPQALDTSLRELLLPRGVKRTRGRPRGRGRPLDSPVLVAG